MVVKLSYLWTIEQFHHSKSLPEQRASPKCWRMTVKLKTVMKQFFWARTSPPKRAPRTRTREPHRPSGDQPASVNPLQCRGPWARGLVLKRKRQARPNKKTRAKACRACLATPSVNYFVASQSPGSKHTLDTQVMNGMMNMPITANTFPCSHLIYCPHQQYLNNIYGIL